MAQPARREDAPPVDPLAIGRAYRLERAKRRARLERSLARRRARLRFYAVVLGLLVLAIVLAVTAWREIERLFGL